MHHGANSAEAHEDALASLREAFEQQQPDEFVPNYTRENLTQDPEFVSDVATPQESR